MKKNILIISLLAIVSFFFIKCEKDKPLNIILYNQPLEVIQNGNVDDRHPLLGSNLLQKIYGKLYGDKGYISQTLLSNSSLTVST
jgi:hypothetical protein